MRTRISVCAACVLMSLPWAVRAQTDNMTVSYLRAVVDSIRDQGPVTVTGIYLPNPGLESPRGWRLSGEGLSRFSIKDVKTDVVFTQLYCRQGTRVFRELIKLAEPKAFHFKGYRGYGEENVPAVYITSLEPAPEVTVSPAAGATNGVYRVTIVDTATSNRTVLANVELGRAYNVEGISVTVERE